MSAQAVAGAVAHPEAEIALITETLCLPGRDLTLTVLLRVLDLLRQQLARTNRGHEGAFAGFDVFDVSAWRDCGEVAGILFTARLVSDDAGSQTVEYAANPCAHDDGCCRLVGAGEPYIQARGRTVALARPREGRAPAPSRGTAVSPRR